MPSGARPSRTPIFIWNRPTSGRTLGRHPQGAPAACRPEITFAVFHLIPVAVAAWISGTKGAVGASGLAAVAWLLAEIASSRIGASGR